MAFTTKQLGVNYTVMITKAANGYILNLLDANGETVRTTIATDYNVRDYASTSLCTALEALWDYAETLANAAKAKTNLAVAVNTELDDSSIPF